LVRVEKTLVLSSDFSFCQFARAMRRRAPTHGARRAARGASARDCGRTLHFSRRKCKNLLADFQEMLTMTA